MPAVIANEWGEADALHKSALIALAVTLFVITIVVNLIATAIVQRSMRRSQGIRRWPSTTEVTPAGLPRDPGST